MSRFLIHFGVCHEMYFYVSRKDTPKSLYLVTIGPKNVTYRDVTGDLNLTTGTVVAKIKKFKMNFIKFNLYLN